MTRLTTLCASSHQSLDRNQFGVQILVAPYLNFAIIKRDRYRLIACRFLKRFKHLKFRVVERSLGRSTEMHCHYNSYSIHMCCAIVSVACVYFLRKTRSLHEFV